MCNSNLIFYRQRYDAGQGGYRRLCGGRAALAGNGEPLRLEPGAEHRRHVGHAADSGLFLPGRNRSALQAGADPVCRRHRVGRRDCQGDAAAGDGCRRSYPRIRER